MIERIDWTELFNSKGNLSIKKIYKFIYLVQQQWIFFYDFIVRKSCHVRIKFQINQICFIKTQLEFRMIHFFIFLQIFLVLCHTYLLTTIVAKAMGYLTCQVLLRAGIFVGVACALQPVSSSIKNSKHDLCYTFFPSKKAVLASIYSSYSISDIHFGHSNW